MLLSLEIPCTRKQAVLLMKDAARRTIDWGMPLHHERCFDLFPAYCVVCMRRWKNVEIMNRIRLVVIYMQMTVGPIVDILACGIFLYVHVESSSDL